jgi:hypothetical protein
VLIHETVNYAISPACMAPYSAGLISSVPGLCSWQTCFEWCEIFDVFARMNSCSVGLCPQSNEWSVHCPTERAGRYCFEVSPFGAKACRILAAISLACCTQRPHFLWYAGLIFSSSPSYSPVCAVAGVCYESFKETASALVQGGRHPNSLACVPTKGSSPRWSLSSPRPTRCQDTDSDQG